MFDEKLWNKTTEIFDRTKEVNDVDTMAAILISNVLNIRDDGAIIFTTQNDFGKQYVFNIIEKDGGIVGEIIDDSTGEILQEWDACCPKLLYHSEVNNG